MKLINEGDVIEFSYKNWKGETSYRKVLVKGFAFGSNKYHKEDQMLLIGFDLDKNAMRTFTTKDVCL